VRFHERRSLSDGAALALDTGDCDSDSDSDSDSQVSGVDRC
jgi:hypothetical protein